MDEVKVEWSIKHLIEEFAGKPLKVVDHEPGADHEGIAQEHVRVKWKKEGLSNFYVPARE